MQTTQNIGLPIFEDGESPAWVGDWNSAMQKIDAAVSGGGGGTGGGFTLYQSYDEIESMETKYLQFFNDMFDHKGGFICGVIKYNNYNVENFTIMVDPSQTRAAQDPDGVKFIPSTKHPELSSNDYLEWFGNSFQNHTSYPLKAVKFYFFD